MLPDVTMCALIVMYTILFTGEGWRGTISSVNGSDFSRQRAKNNVEMDAEAMFKAILQEKVAGGGADELDRETFCRWFVRYRGMKFFSDISLIYVRTTSFFT